METWGRKITLQISALIFNVGAIIMTVATTQLSMIYAGRALTGIAVGGITAVVPCYIAEQAPNAIRGQLTGFFEVAYQIGAVIGFWVCLVVLRGRQDSQHLADIIFIYVRQFRSTMESE
jgi:MFS family permease